MPQNSYRIAGFTLIEMVLVMALLATLMAVAAPSLSRSFHGRNLAQQAEMLLAATEYARGEAVSQGVPMNLWVDVASASFGVKAKTGYESTESREKSWTLHPDVRFESTPPDSDGYGHSLAATFEPEGTLGDISMDEIRLADRSGETIAIQRSEDGYEIVK